MLSDEELSDLFDEALELYKLAVVANPVENLDVSQEGAVELSTTALSKFLELRNLLQNRLEGAIEWQQCTASRRYLLLEYYLGLNMLHNFEEARIWDKVKNLYQAARFFIDYLWTVFELGVPGLDVHSSLIQMITPKGRYSNFDLDPFRADISDSLPQERLHNIAALWAELNDGVSPTDRSIKFYQYSATDSLLQILDITRNKLPACLELAHIEMETVNLKQPIEVLAPVIGGDIWSSFSSSGS